MANDFHKVSGTNRRSLTRKTLTVKSLARFAADESGATSIEYGLICSLIFLAIVASVNGVASATNNMHSKISGSLN